MRQCHPVPVRGASMERHGSSAGRTAQSNMVRAADPGSTSAAVRPSGGELAVHGGSADAEHGGGSLHQERPAWTRYTITANIARSSTRRRPPLCGRLAGTEIIGCATPANARVPPRRQRHDLQRMTRRPGGTSVHLPTATHQGVCRTAYSQNSLGGCRCACVTACSTSQVAEPPKTLGRGLQEDASWIAESPHVSSRARLEQFGVSDLCLMTTSDRRRFRSPPCRSPPRRPMVAWLAWSPHGGPRPGGPGGFRRHWLPVSAFAPSDGGPSASPTRVETAL